MKRGCGRYTEDVGGNPIVCGENGVCETCEIPCFSSTEFIGDAVLITEKDERKT